MQDFVIKNQLRYKGIYTKEELDGDSKHKPVIYH